MKVKVIMIPIRDLTVIPIDYTVGQALDLINANRLLSLPVVDGKKFIGVLSKQHMYETCFEEFEGTKEEFRAQSVRSMMKTKVPGISENTPIEEAAAVFIESKFRFIPVLDENNELEGIVTQQAIFKEYQKLFGSAYNTFTVYSFDYKGTLAKISELIAKGGGNIKNVVLINTDVLGLQEIFFRVETDDLENIVKILKKKGFDVRLQGRD